MRHALRRGMKNPGARAVGVSMVAGGRRVAHLPTNSAYQYAGCTGNISPTRERQTSPS